MNGHKHKENTSLKPLAGKIKGANFVSFCNQWCSETGVSEVSRLGCLKKLGVVMCNSWSRDRQTTLRKTARSEASISGTGEIVLFGVHL